MSRDEWEQTYWAAWRTYYTFAHMCTLMRRAAATRISLGKMLSMLLSFWSLSLIEHTHPLEGGYLRRKVRTERRPGLPIVPAWRFWPGYAADLVVKHVRIGDDGGAAADGAPQVEAGRNGARLPRPGADAGRRRRAHWNCSR